VVGLELWAACHGIAWSRAAFFLFVVWGCAPQIGGGSSLRCEFGLRCAPEGVAFTVPSAQSGTTFRLRVDYFVLSFALKGGGPFLSMFTCAEVFFIPSKCFRLGDLDGGSATACVFGLSGRSVSLAVLWRWVLGFC